MKKESTATKKIVVISGGSGYLGNSISKLLSSRGLIIVKLDADITKIAAVKKFADKVVNQHGQIFGIIHAASAPLIRKPMLAGTENNFKSQFSVNVIGAFHLFKSLSPAILPGGVIIGITTTAIEPNTVHSFSGSYIPAKYALKGMLRVLNNELKNRSIRVYALAPAFMPGGLNKDLPKAVKTFIEKSTPKEITSPVEVAKVVLELIDDTSGTLKGKSISIPNRSTTNL